MSLVSWLLWMDTSAEAPWGPAGTINPTLICSQPPLSLPLPLYSFYLLPVLTQPLSFSLVLALSLSLSLSLSLARSLTLILPPCCPPTNTTLLPTRNNAWEVCYCFVHRSALISVRASLFTPPPPGEGLFSRRVGNASNARTCCHRAPTGINT